MVFLQLLLDEILLTLDPQNEIGGVASPAR